MSNEIQIGTQIRNADGRLGTVTFIHPERCGSRIIEWKSCGRWYFSDESVLSVADTSQLRWRKKEVEA
jgi:hypothetical protein